MCGIVGALSWNGTLDSARYTTFLKDMSDRLVHRGPDGSGFYFNGPIALGHRRLSIIDLAGGQQPMANEDRTLWIVFNGEIYNFKELKPILEAKGHHYATESDTEALLHLYEEHGESFLEYVDGMFAFALWDSKKKRLILARDRMGEKPLYYAQTSSGVIFASEIKALLALPDLDLQLDPQALESYLTLGYIPAPLSIYKSVRKVRAGEMLVCEAGRISKKDYWDIPTGMESKASDAELEEELESLLDKSVKERLVSDVPLGVFLSGGVDSTVVAALAARHKKGLKTFSIGFAESSYDESSVARQTAQALGTDHHEQIIGDEDSLRLIPTLGDFIDEPFADSSIIPTFLLSKFARQQVTVALGGDGADELLGGYPTYSAHYWADLYAKIPAVAAAGISKLMKTMPTSDAYMSWEFKVNRFLGAAQWPLKKRHMEWMSLWQSRDLADLYGGSLKPTGSGIFSELDQASYLNSGPSALKAMNWDIKTYFPEDLMVKVDRASMANSLEVRAPFLAKDVVEFSARLPLRLRATRFKTKVLLKKVLRKIYPGFPSGLPKHGFAIPVGAWLKGALRPLIEDLLSPRAVSSWGLFDVAVVERIKSEHFQGKRNNSRQIWALLLLELWKNGKHNRINTSANR